MSEDHDACERAIERVEAAAEREMASLRAELASSMLALGNAHLATAKVEDEDEVDRLRDQRDRVLQICRDHGPWLHADQIAEVYADAEPAEVARG